MSESGADTKAWGSRRIWEMVFLFGALGVAFVLSEGLLRDKTGPEDAVPAAAAPWTGSSADVQSREVREAIDVAASVEAVRVAHLAARVQAQVASVNVRPGDRVTTGQRLITLSVPELDSRSRSASAAIGAASARAEQLARDRARMERLLASEAATMQEVERAREAESVAAADLARARAAAGAEADVAAMKGVDAPFDGVIVARHVDPGDLASPGQPLLVVADDSAFHLEASVDERIAGSLSVGSIARCIVESIALDEACAVIEIVPASDPATRTVLVKASLAARPDLRHAAFGRLALDGAPRTAILVPMIAIERIGGLTSVRVLDESGRARLRNVRLGGAHGDDIEVLSGLRVGERVATP